MMARAAWIPARARKLGVRLERARELLFAYLTDPLGPAGEPLEALAVLPRSEQLAMLGGLSRQLDGPEKARLEGLAASLGLVEAAVAACSRRLWWERLHGVRTLLLLGAPASIPEKLVRDSHPLVRAEAVRRWSGVPLEGIPHLLVLLDDPTPVGRFAVQDALLKIGSAASKALGEYLTRANPAGLTAAIEVAARLADSTHLQPALDLSSVESAEVRASAARLLGSLGGAQARERLLELLTDQSPAVRQAALSSLAGIGEWSVAPQVASCLSDQEWAVRQRAALTLSEFGSVGKLYLLKAAEQQDGPAAIMARYALSLPQPAAGSHS
jgi:HEAT repeat protein